MTVALIFMCVISVIEWSAPPCEALVAPEDVGTAFAAIYGFTPRIVIGRDHRLGFGFRFGNHADFQLLYELGPQTNSAPLGPPTTNARAAGAGRLRRRPLVELMVLAGLRLTAGPGLRPSSWRWRELEEAR